MTKAAKSPRWPNGYVVFRRSLQRIADVIAHGSVLAIDPASGRESLPGWALFQGGVLKSSGTVPMKGKASTKARMEELYSAVATELPEADVLIIEQLRGRNVSPTLHWATGVSIAAASVDSVLELPIAFWKALSLVKEDYVKGDEADAIVIGETAVRLAQICLKQKRL